MRRCTLYETLKRNVKLNASVKYLVLSNVLKVLKFCCNDCGRLFQILADALEKARSLSVFFDRREKSSNWILVNERRLYVEVFLLATMLFR